ncbi:MAG: hypothetical protein D8M58_17910 [Calditrichaeota bacterium]|nr:MAG: hypothetical protein DWQ03_01825 [Calditrichota bacterium]MBL1207284.1 hypothetical protein [Calditrichota bacterium]NOG47116.1 hypothetical protein [Calditrichota bacterium]
MEQGTNIDLNHLQMLVSVQPWPESQLCMTCEYGEFVNSETFTWANYICFKSSLLNDGIDCPLFIEKKQGSKK